MGRFQRWVDTLLLEKIIFVVDISKANSFCRDGPYRTGVHTLLEKDSCEWFVGVVRASGPLEWKIHKKFHLERSDSILPQKYCSYQTLGCHFVEGRVLYKMHVPASLIHDLLTLVPPFCSERFLLQHGGHAFCRKTPSRTFTRPPIL